MTRYEIVVSLRAQDHLLAIENYIGEAGSPRNAAGYVAKISRAIQDLEYAPHRGSLRPDGTRTIGFQRRVTIHFSVRERTVIIAGVYYAGRQIEGDEGDE